MRHSTAMLSTAHVDVKMLVRTCIEVQRTVVQTIARAKRIAAHVGAKCMSAYVEDCNSESDDNVSDSAADYCSCVPDVWEGDSAERD